MPVLPRRTTPAAPAVFNFAPCFTLVSLALFSACTLGLPSVCQVAPPVAPRPTQNKAGQSPLPTKPQVGRAFAPLPPAVKAPDSKSPPNAGLPGAPVVPPAPPTLPPAGPPLPLLPTLPRRAFLIGAVSPALGAQTARLDVDAAILEGALPVLWRGTAYVSSADASEPVSSAPPALTRLSKASGATLARISPFARAGVVTPGADGVPVVRWEDIDAALRRAARNQADVVFIIQPPPVWSESAWNALIAATLRHYRAGSPTPILRWELAGDAAQVSARYAAFARQARALYPTAPLGVYLTSGDIGEGTRRTALACAPAHIPLDSIGWRLPFDPSAAEASARTVRAALSAYPALKGTLLLPTLPVQHSGGEGVSAAGHLVALCARVIEAAPSLPPNSLGGVLASEDRGADTSNEKSAGAKTGGAGHSEVSGGSMAGEDATGTLALLNRLAGTRLRARSDDGGVGCLASQSGAHTRVLLWRAANEERAGTRLAPSANAPVLVRLHHLAAGEAGLRAARIASGDGLSLSALSAALASTSTTSTSPVASTNGVGDGMAADIPLTGNVVPGELELTTLLAPGEVCLLDIAPRAPTFLQTTLAVSAQSLRGGDPFEVVLTARNVSPTPRPIETVLTSNTTGVLPQAAVRLTLGTLPAGGTRAFRFTLHAPIVAFNDTLTVGAQTGDAQALVTLPVAPALLAELASERADVGEGSTTADVRVRLINRGRSPLALRLHGDGEASVSITLPPDGKPQTAAIAVAPPANIPGVYPARVQVESGGRTLQTLTAYVGVPFGCPRAQATPAIDGDLGEWTGDMPLGMGRAEQAHGKTWGGPSDLSAYAFTRWDARYFYFACAVTDDVFVAPTLASKLEQGDSVLIALAANGGGKANGTVGSNGTARPGRAETAYAMFGMALLRNAKGGLEPVLARLSRPNGRAGQTVAEAVKDGRVAIRREGSRIFYEAAIPWTRILTTSQMLGQTLGLSILVNDIDDNTVGGKGVGARRGWMEWGGGLAGSVQPALFWPLRLTR